jgi:hypothetical protein
MRKTVELNAEELVNPSPELNAAIAQGNVIISIRKDAQSFLGVWLSPSQARELASHISDLANEIEAVKSTH